MPTVFGYIRVSQQDQADSGHTLTQHRELLERQYAAAWQPHGYDWGDVFEERAVSGSLPFASRPAGARLDARVGRGDVVLFPKLDRGFRSVRDALATIDGWAHRGVRAVFLDLNLDYSTDAGRFMFTLIAAGAEFERARGRNRVIETMTGLKRRGRVLGQPPFGVRCVGRGDQRKRVLVPEQFELGKQVVQWKLQGYSFGDIARHLNVNNVRRPTPVRGQAGNKPQNRWHEKAVERVYRSTLKVLDWVEKKKVSNPT